MITLYSTPILALSPDWHKALLNSRGVPTEPEDVALTIATLGQQTLIDPHTWSEITPRSTSATWISNARVAYFRYNPSIQLTDLVIRDTTLVKLDSFVIDRYADLNYGSIFHTTGKFILAGSFGVLNLDSST